MFGNRQLLAAAVLVVIAAACGSGGATSSQTAGPIWAPSSASAPATAVPSSEVEGATGSSGVPATGTGAAIGGLVAKGGDYCGLLGAGTSPQPAPPAPLRRGEL